MKDFLREELLQELTDVRVAAMRLAAICKSARKKPCPQDCPGLFTCWNPESFTHFGRMEEKI